MSEARGRTSEGGAVNRNWFVDSQSYDLSYESVEAVFDGLSPGDWVEIEECTVVRRDVWQLVPVEESGAICRCGKSEGCGDFLGAGCHAERAQPMKVDELPEGWRAGL